MNRQSGIGSSLLVVAGLCTANAHAQCLQWAPGFEPAGVGGGRILDLAIFDDGGGARLYALGDFQTAGTVRANHIAAWNGSTWSPLGAGLGLPTYAPSAMASFDDGNGMELYVGEVLSTPGGVLHVEKWDGATWSALVDPAIVGGVFDVRDFAVFDEGSGPTLFAAGQFGLGGSLGIQAIRRWDGSAWSVVGAGITGYVEKLVVFDDGAGPALYAAGNFTGAGGPAGHRIAKWDGVAWSPVAGFNGSVDELPAIDDGNPGGPALIAGGAFSNAGGTPASRIAKWDGSTWSALGTGIDPVGLGGPSSVASLAYFDSGSGPELYVGGSFVGAGGSPARNLAKWNGSSWSSVNDPNEIVNELLVFDDGLGGGAALYATGFTVVGTTVAHHIARWNGSTWSALGTYSNAVAGRVRATLTFDDGNGEALFIAGEISAAGSVPVNGIARWDGTNWSDMNGGMSGHPASPSNPNGGDVYALAVFDDGSGDALYAGGLFSHAGGTPASCVAKWNGTSWSSVGATLVDRVQAMAVFDDGSGPALYVGGFFPSQDYITRWNGSVWQPVGAGLNATVYAMKVFNDSTGPALYVGGAFSEAGGSPATGIARWTGGWNPVGTGTAGQVNALEVYSGGTGVPSLYVGGGFSNAGGVAVDQIAKWSGSAWSAVGSGLGQSVYALHVSDGGNGNGQVLYAGGDFTIANGAPADRLARWNGTSWSATGGGVDLAFGGEVSAISSFDHDGDGRADLFVGGEFAATPGGNSENLALWRHCAGPGTPFCFGDGSAGDCPCTPPNDVPIPSGSNFGGCANSFNPHGGGMSATGNIQPSDTVTLIASGISPVGFCQFFKTDAASTPGLGVLDGISCASGNLIRFGNQNAAGGVAKYPNPPLGLVTPVSVRGATPVGSGLTGYYQVVYRNTKIGFCTADTLNFSSSYRITWN